MVGFLFQMKDEFTVDEDELDHPPSKNDFMMDVPAHTIPDNFDTDNIYKTELCAMFREKFPTEEADTLEAMWRWS